MRSLGIEDRHFVVKAGTFEGTPGELLRLVMQDKIDLASIPLADIAKQLHEAVEAQDVHEIDLDQAVDQVIALVTLIGQKARNLLPGDAPYDSGGISCEAAGEPEESSGLREMLLERLEEYKEYKHIAEELRQREELWHKVRSRPPVPELKPDLPSPACEAPDTVTLDDLLNALEALLKSVPENVPVPSEELSIQERMEAIVSRLRDSGRLGFRELLSGSRSRSEIIAMFVALLELIRLGRVRASQDRHFGEIIIAIVEPNR
ncbi:MAG TPA: segregation/condensation protein A [Firmicutes bacterium]|nr:segregation/condensation protein A [Bacillota bacterium]